MSRTHTRALFVALSMLLVLATACSPVRAKLVDEGASYTRESATARLESTDAGDLADRPVSEAEDLRSAALVSLRRQGDAGTQIADLVTATFPPGTKGVPIYAEKASFEGEPAWLVIEAIGKEGSTFSDRRLWVLDLEGEILFSAIR